eukprot:TRINITY_DN573_c0_g1_i1.p1 TRINITY_DN573_c0_g1~~TRINITY_DN573_c0_g1_i1.p1  ORF type:complete len:345 (-),score=71.24 TRINITY_DN573_c0_g1_i1:84-1118(-)
MAQTVSKVVDPSKNDGYVPRPDYVRVDYVQPHWTRRKAILKAHPEVKELQKQDVMSAVWVVVCFAAMTGLAYLVRNSSWGSMFLVSYVVGATILHAMWVLIHELTHDLVFASSTLNTAFLLLCNIPHIIPSGISFRHYHRQHHGHLNETYADPDVPSPIENTIFGTTSVGKATWLCFFSIIQAIRVLRHMATPLGPRFEVATFANFALNGLYAYSIYHFWGLTSLVFLVLSSLMAVGLFLHPLGARWIAEHYAVHPDQETYSYYGMLNLVMFNIGYHNEHHDFPNVPWNKLPLLKKISPEYYEPLHQHLSYLRVLYEFVFNDEFTLKTRVVRWSRGGPVGEKLD